MCDTGELCIAKQSQQASEATSTATNKDEKPLPFAIKHDLSMENGGTDLVGIMERL